MNTSLARASGMLLIFLVAAGSLGRPAFAQAVPNWNVTVPLHPGHAAQKVGLTATTLTIDRRFPQNKAHVAFPLKTIKSIKDPYQNNGTWAIDVELNKAAHMQSILDLGATDSVVTTEVSIMFLAKSDAATGKAYLLSKIGSR